MQANLIQNSFLYGEVSPDLYGRVDSPAYNSGAKTLRNYVVKKIGGATRRPGTVYDFEVKDSSKSTRIVPFEYRSDRFLLEFGEGYIRFHKQTASGFTLVTDDGWTFPYSEGGAAPDPLFHIGNVLAFEQQSRYDAPATTGFGPVQLTTTGTLPTGLATSTDYWLIVTTSVAGLPPSVWPPYGPARTFYIGFATSRANAIAGTFIPLTGSGTGVHTLTLNLAAYEIQTDYLEADLDGLRFAQDDNTLYIASELNYPARLIKLDNYLAGIGSDAKWRLDNASEYAGPWRYAAPLDVGGDANIRLTIATSSFTSPGATFTIGVGFGTSYPPGSLMALDLLRLGDRIMLIDNLDPNSWGVAEITSEGVAPTFVLTATILKAWSVGAVSPMDCKAFWMQNDWTQDSGYPPTVAISNSRVILAGGGSSPHIAHYSSLDTRRVFWPINHDGTVTASTAFDVDVFGDQDVPIQSIIAIWDLFLITSKGVWSLGPTGTAAVTPATISARQITAYGGGSVQPVSSERMFAYISGTGKRAYGVIFKSFASDQDTYEVVDLSLFSDHILSAGVQRMAYQQEPYSSIWCVLNDGNLASMTIHSEENAIGWAKQTIAGTAVTVEDIVVMPSFDDTEQVVYLLVKRTINGGVVRYVEHISPFVRSGDLGDFLYLDCAATYSGGATQTPSGFDNLEGETVHVVSDDVYVGTFAVASGQIDLGAGNTGSEVHAGFTYNSDLETLTPEVQTPFGTVQGSLKRIARSVLRVQNAKSGKIGRDASNLDPIEYEATALFTGDVEIPVEIGSERNPTLYVRQDLPYPLDIDAIVTRVDLESRGGP